MNDSDTGLHHHVHGQTEFDHVADAVRDVIRSGVMAGYVDFGVVTERREKGGLFVYILPVPPAPGLVHGD